jgi:hypothetical protein
MNGKNIETHELTKDEEYQARSFMKVMVHKKYNVPEMANIMQHMGAMLVELAKGEAEHYSKAE